MATQLETKDKIETKETVKKEIVYSPRTNVYETKDSAVFILEMPGVDSQSLDISFEKGSLSIEGKVDADSLRSEYQTEYLEGRQTVYRRSFTIGKPVNVDEAQAEWKNGTLKLTLPKVEPQKKKITIQNS
ncbi:Hsp20/alpha crystallin family protein [Leptospira sp. GIMC2001]|uniref:Hsp20/alpha crystallin family protein n=1 Tax=Leptospira sp. GIMC2001 TaxID=1513297 RepID=UPI00234A13FD|nr:Hsp20/alpha crystallin family protein [Leptospira sp. GIMC2001]WCL50964.1 Hsp20/alpha crystallin family protein [Leptospira sp. GIMC2001]